MDTRKRDEWRELCAQQGGIVDWRSFLRFALLNPKSAFYDDVIHDKDKAAKEYYAIKAKELVRRYVIAFNPLGAQRMYRVPDIAGSGFRYKKAEDIVKTDDENKVVIACLWSRLRSLVKDIEPFIHQDRKLLDIYGFLEGYTSLEKARQA